MSTLTNCLIKKDTSCVPIWFMRQAGRYLPEFRKIRLKNNNFIKLCLNSHLASEITIQPINRFDLDAAIIFSDILIIPHALGQEVKFIKNTGPLLPKPKLRSILNCKNEIFLKKLNPVYQAISKTRKKLDNKKSLIAFVGAPWTLVVYMLGLKTKENKLNMKEYKKKRGDIDSIINMLTNFLCIHIKKQIDAGADTVQIFDSWAGIIPTNDLGNYCYLPNLKLVEFCKKNKIPVICFPKGIKKKYADFYKMIKPNGISIDYDIKPEWAAKNLKGASIQGGMSPNFMFLKEEKIFQEAEKYLKVFKNLPYVFNLGHGLLPGTNPYKLEKLINFVRNYK